MAANGTTLQSSLTRRRNNSFGSRCVRMNCDSRINDSYRVKAQFSNGLSSAGLGIVAGIMVLWCFDAGGSSSVAVYTDGKPVACQFIGICLGFPLRTKLAFRARRPLRAGSEQTNPPRRFIDLQLQTEWRIPTRVGGRVDTAGRITGR